MNIIVFFQEYLRSAIRRPSQFLKKYPSRLCTICGYEGRFLDVGPRPEARCPNCSSKERDRIMGLYLRRNGLDLSDKAVLHFSPERPFFRLWRRNPRYVAGDVKISKVANAVVDITDIQFDDGHFDYLICHHILEHVAEDAKGIDECLRVLKPGGSALFSVPLDQERAETWEPPPDMPAAEVERICGWDHVRLYGRDFPDKLSKAGFSISEITFTQEEGERHRLTEKHGLALQGLDRIFVGTVPVEAGDSQPSGLSPSADASAGIPSNSARGKALVLD
ncbi:class I SAM-dependent methyltransferase [Bosea sp. BH3]|uniref:class I SAM-dependent methyltransferase n=1 Tax=Bosea sp. BH3 TaxID=2871701 RepID=UPI0021CB53B6|nr:class I SAM-dependent methyltransferase [Bosea sp. BH3]MCU4182500.1 methyltransferase domain-containing protein [Bosea sp. BH3]